MLTTHKTHLKKKKKHILTSNNQLFFHFLKYVIRNMISITFSFFLVALQGTLNTCICNTL